MLTPNVTTGSSGKAATGSSLTGITASQAQNQFLQLLTAELKNQDPTSPVSNTDFIAQLAQFSQLQGVQQLNGSISQLVALQQVTQAASLIGKQVTYLQPGNPTPGRGVISAVSINNGQLQVVVGGQTIPLERIQGFQQPAGVGAVAGA
ncbi:MAG TPA: flagellar hook capping FlgD N-terminal domain-containing protein [Gemmataceae bacterium]|nr:flagellar hook capping FlgD N-terminal domain-containing protein [Gemmataceae bacterium]